MFRLLLSLVLAQTATDKVPTTVDIVEIHPSVSTTKEGFTVVVTLEPKALVEEAHVEIFSQNIWRGCTITIRDGAGSCKTSGPALSGPTLVWAIYYGSEVLAYSSDTVTHRVSAIPAVTVWPMPSQVEDIPIADRWKFVVSDEENGGADLVVTLSSSRPDLITHQGLNAHIEYGIEDGNRTGYVTLKPQPDAFGAVPVVFEVRDLDGATASLETMFHISPINDPPRFLNGDPAPVTNLDQPACALNWLDVDVGPGESESWRPTVISFTRPELFEPWGTPFAFSTSLCFAPNQQIAGTFDVTIEAVENSSPPLTSQKTFSITILEGRIFGEGGFE